MEEKKPLSYVENRMSKPYPTEIGAPKFALDITLMVDGLKYKRVSYPTHPSFKRTVLLKDLPSLSKI